MICHSLGGCTCINSIDKEVVPLNQSGSGKFVVQECQGDSKHHYSYLFHSRSASAAAARYDMVNSIVVVVVAPIFYSAGRGSAEGLDAFRLFFKPHVLI